MKPLPRLVIISLFLTLCLGGLILITSLVTGLELRLACRQDTCALRWPDDSALSVRWTEGGITVLVLGDYNQRLFSTGTIHPALALALGTMGFALGGLVVMGVIGVVGKMRRKG